MNNDGDFTPNIDVLIGSDYYFDVINDEVRRGDGGPVAVNSEFGWIISGRGYAKTSEGDGTLTQLIVDNTESATLFDPLYRGEDEGLTSAIRRFWDTESLGILEPEPLLKTEFLRDPKFDESRGRYQVSLPWKDGQVPTSNGYFPCLTRLRQLHSRLKADPELLKQYDNVIQEQVQSGIIEQVPGTSANDESTHFLPHHGVIRKDKVTTKVRVVFDGSAKHGTSNSSLNECLEKGPNLVPHLFDIVIKFRGYPVGIVADVEKAFHQIEISPGDRRMLRFLWFDDIYKKHPNIVEYQFCRLVFGLTPSPAILTSVIQRHLESCKVKEPEIVSLLQDSFYVDDFVGGALDDEQAIEIHEKANDIMNAGGFVLRKWHSNSKILQTKVARVPERAEEENVSTTMEPLGSEQDASKNNNLIRKENRTVVSEQFKSDHDDETKSAHFVKILGLHWNFETDEIKYDLSELVNYAATLLPTKRSVLRLTAKVFDPLGLLAPFTISMKVWFQTLCVQGVNWDDMLDGEALAAWNQFILDLSALHDVRIQRCYFQKRNEKPISYQLHGFSDASSKAYAAVVYLRTVHRNGEIEVNLVASKTRVAPLQKQSIPRLELLGASLLARLMSSVVKALGSLTMTPDVFYWTDSYTVLCWIRNNKVWKTYVNHRVQEIRKLTKQESWRFCPGEVNPADLPSRGCRGVELTKNKTWWNGPEFLGCTNELWPSEPNTTKSDEVNALAEVAKPKTKPTITRSLINVTDKLANIEAVMDCKRYSTKSKLLRVTALVKRFISNARRQQAPASNVITADELRTAEKLWLKAIQANSFEDERAGLLGVSKKETLFAKQLDLFLDEEDIIRCQGRIEHSSLPVAAKQPILLPTRHHYTELVIHDCHEIVHHNGVKETLNCIREVYWIPRGREAVKRVLGACVLCRKHEGKSYATAKISTLPPSRVSDEPPFVNTGIDFAGPLYVKIDVHDGKERMLTKAYVCLYTCASTRALHLELVPNLSVTAFLQSFRRFTARRGLPTRLLSDNAKTFKAAAKEVKAIARSTEVQQYLANKGIIWDFIIEKAPWQGGFWERMVKCVKRCLKKAVGRASLSYEEMRTILIEIEATLNNRPMTYIYDDKDGISYPLTPAALVYGRNIATTPNARQFEVISMNQSLTRRQKYHKRLLDQFTKQWRNEYLTSLRESSNPKGSVDKRSKCTVEVGEIVVLRNDKSSRAYWKLARVEELLPSKDGVVRAAKVRVVNQENGKSSCLRRPIQHLIPLEIRSSYKQSDDESGQLVEKTKEDVSAEETETLRPMGNNITRYSLRSGKS